MFKKKIILLTLILLFISSSAYVIDGDPDYKIPEIKLPSWSSSDDFKKAEKSIIKKIKLLESTFLEKDWEMDFAYVYHWVSKVPYIKVKLDIDYLIHMAEPIRRKNRDAIYFAYMFWYGNVLYLLEHPKAKPHHNKVIKRGFRAMVNFYNSVREKNNWYRNQLIEWYEELLDDDEMDEYINFIKKKYKKKNKKKK